MQLYDFKTKRSRVLLGPQLIMLGPEESFTVVSLSGGKPKRPHAIKDLALLLGPDFSTDILGTFLSRTFFGFQLQLGDPHMGSAIATAMFGIILIGVCIYLFGIQTRLRRYQF